MENSMEVPCPPRLKIQLLSDPAIPLLGMYAKEFKAGSRRYLHIHVHHSQEVEAIQTSINRWMDKDNVVYPHNGILCNLKKEWKPVTCYNVDYNVIEIIQSQKTNTVLSHSFEVPKVVKIIDMESRKVDTKGWGERGN